ncbi:MAG: hypothetical protein ACM36C_11805, partial [Acidobacteriota bacterium]
GAVLVVAVAGIRLALTENMFGLRQQEQRYVWVGRYIQDHTPSNAAIICMQHSGSIRYYGGRLTIRYDGIEDVDKVVDRVREVGYKPYILVEEWERAEFISRFGERSRLGKLDWVPVANLLRPVLVELFDPEARPLLGDQAIIPRSETTCEPSRSRVVP